jgi:anti-repressor protein
MSQEILPQAFDNPEFGTIRVVKSESGEPLFLVKDICDFFGVTNRNRVLQQLDDDEKGGTQIDTPGGKQTMTYLTEAGLYHFLFIIQPSKARGIPQEEIDAKCKLVNRYKRWVTHEVLPAIRRDGGYMVARDETPEETMARAVLIANRTIERQKAQIDEMRPKALFADAVAASDGTCLIGELAKMMTQAGFQIGQNRLFKLLRDDGFLGKSGSNRNVPLQRYVEMGLFKIKETAITHADGHVTINRTPKVTGKGQRYFIERYCGCKTMALA